MQSRAVIALGCHLGALHTSAAVAALVLGPLYAFAPLTRKPHRRLADAYFGLMLLMALSSLVLGPSDTGFHGLHVASALVVLVLGWGWGATFCRAPSALGHDREVTSALATYAILLISAILETANRILVPWLTARGFEAWGLFWTLVAFGILVVAVLSLPLSRAARRRLERVRPDLPIPATAGSNSSGPPV